MLKKTVSTQKRGLNNVVALGVCALISSSLCTAGLTSYAYAEEVVDPAVAAEEEIEAAKLKASEDLEALANKVSVLLNAQKFTAAKKAGFEAELNQIVADANRAIHAAASKDDVALASLRGQNDVAKLSNKIVAAISPEEAAVPPVDGKDTKPAVTTPADGKDTKPAVAPSTGDAQKDKASGADSKAQGSASASSKKDDSKAQESNEAQASAEQKNAEDAASEEAEAPKTADAAMLAPAAMALAIGATMSALGIISKKNN